MYIHMADKILLVRIVYIDILICVYTTYVAAPVLPIYKICIYTWLIR